MKRRLLGLVTVLALGTLVTAACSSPAASPTNTPTKAATTPVATTPATTGTSAVTKPGAEAGAAKVFTIKLTENPYKFDPAAYEMEVGKRYHFKLTSGAEEHSFTVDALKIDETVKAGQTVTFDYTPTAAAASLKLICIPHEASGMVGTVTVK